MSGNILYLYTKSLRALWYLSFAISNLFYLGRAMACWISLQYYLNSSHSDWGYLSLSQSPASTLRPAATYKPLRTFLLSSHPLSSFLFFSLPLLSLPLLSLPLFSFSGRYYYHNSTWKVVTCLCQECRIPVNLYHEWKNQYQYMGYSH